MAEREPTRIDKLFPPQITYEETERILDRTPHVGAGWRRITVLSGAALAMMAAVEIKRKMTSNSTEGES